MANAKKSNGKSNSKSNTKAANTKVANGKAVQQFAPKAKVEMPIYASKAVVMSLDGARRVELSDKAIVHGDSAISVTGNIVTIGHAIDEIAYVTKGGNDMMSSVTSRVVINGKEYNVNSMIYAIGHEEQ